MNQITTNIPEFAVSELAGAIKKTIEGSYGRVRVRGELGRVTVPHSGHMYATIKDDNAALDAVCWKGTMTRLSIKPEEGMEVICTGRITTYPQRSNYQLVIESMELAGQGAILAMLEARKKKLASQGLFSQDRKRAIPFLPRTIGVVTSPTGAVIRDILHRLDARFPRHVLVWPVVVQGENAGKQIANAIKGFDGLSQNMKPDVLIVARGGGSIEDLMPFNDEAVVRAASDCSIPLISAVGHETDTTLIDFASDARAPTPTAAAEMAVPVRADLMANTARASARLTAAAARLLDDKTSRLDNVAARLGQPARMLEPRAQSIDIVSDRLLRAFSSFVEIKRASADKVAAKLVSPQRLLAESTRSFLRASDSISRQGELITKAPAEKLAHALRMLQSLSFESVLERGFAIVRDEKTQKPIMDADALRAGQKVQIQFRRDKFAKAIISEKPKQPEQSSLFE